MKKSYKFLLVVEIISILILLLLIYLSVNIYYIIGFLITKLLLVIKYFGLEKKNDRYEKENLLNVLFIVLAYYFITYILGLFIEFVQSSYIIDFVHIIKNALPVLIIILLSELLRYEYTTKGKENKLIICISVLFFILVDVSYLVKLETLKDLDAIIKCLGTIVLPSIAKNIMLTYQCYYSNYKITIIYRCLMELPVYMLPILPNLGIYINSSIQVILPAIILYITYELYKSKDNHDKIKKSKTYDIFFYLVIAALIFITALTSGLFKYYILAVGSGSMTPNVNKGDAVIVEKLDIDEIKKIKIGEILVFKKEGKIIVHRVVQKNKITEDEYYFYTKGDNNNSYDGYPISIDNIIGVVKVRIKFIGYPTVLLNEILERGE